MCQYSRLALPGLHQSQILVGGYNNMIEMVMAKHGMAQNDIIMQCVYSKANHYIHDMHYRTGILYMPVGMHKFKILCVPSKYSKHFHILHCNDGICYPIQYPIL